MKSFFSKHIISRLLSGKLSAEEDRDLRERRSTVSRMEEQWNAPQTDMPDFNAQKIWRRIDFTTRSGLRPAERKFAQSVRIWAAAACALILLGAGYLWFRSEQTLHQEVRMAVYETQNRQRMRLTLPDSSRVWLNAGSRIAFPDRFAENERRVELTGEAYFDVAPRQDRPFIVTTNRLQVRVSGTQFTVADYKGESTAETVLISGKVSVNLPNENYDRIIELSPGERLLHDRNSALTTVQNVDAARSAEWTNGRLSFDNTELGVIVGKLNRWYGIRVACPEALKKRYRFTFIVRDESPDQIMQLMRRAAPIEFNRTENGFDIYESKNNIKNK